MDLNTALPWGLTVAQTAFLGCGGMLILGAWLILTNVLQVGKNILMCGLVLIMGLICCAATAFAFLEVGQ
jgi:hypothetical protein